jgi:hypothetical protein
MMRLIFFICCILFYVAYGQPAWHWAKNINCGFVPYTSQLPLAEDAAGNIFLSANTWDGSGSGSADTTWIIKLDAQGGELWRKLITRNFMIYDAVCLGGSYYACGIFKDTLQLDNAVLQSKGAYDGFLARFSAQGALLWIKTLSGVKYDAINSLCVDADQNIWITGGFADTATFENNELVCQGDQNMLIARYDSTGALQYLKTAGSACACGYSQGWRIRADLAGDLYILGDWNEMLLDGFYLPDCSCSPYGNPIFLAKMSRQGSVQWLNSSLRENMVYGVTGMDFDAAGNVYTTGCSHWSGSLYDINKFDRNGNRLWSRDITGGYYSSFGSAGVAVRGSSVLSTAYFHDAHYNGSNWISISGMMLFSVDTAGNILYMDSLPGAGRVQPRELVYNSTGDHYLLNGYMTDSCQVGGTQLSATAGSLFLLKSTPGALPVPAQGSKPLFSVWPNPSAGLLHIAGSYEAGALRLFNALGERVPLSVDGEELRVTAPPGIYYLQANKEDSGTVMKLVIQR